MNVLKTTALLALMTACFVAMGGTFGGRMGMLLMFGVAAVMNLGTWFFADSMVIRATGAQEVPRGGQLDWLHQDLIELSEKANMPVPRLYWTPNPSPNAFATGRSPSKGVVAVTDGLLRTLDRREVKGVLAHELGHIKHRDTLISAVAATLAGAISFIAQSMLYSRRREGNGILRLVAVFVAPFAAMLLRTAISRTREYAADRRAAELTGDPNGLADALEALSRGVERQPMRNPAAQNVHMVVNGFTGGLAGWMSTHPPIEERVKRLRLMGRV